MLAQYYATLLANGQENRARFTTKLPMLSSKRGLYQAPLPAGVQQVAADIVTDTVPSSGHTFAEDNPGWVAERLSYFFNYKGSPWRAFLVMKTPSSAEKT